MAYRQKFGGCGILYVLDTAVEIPENCEGEDFADREHATALLMACRHLPRHLSTASQTASMLDEAARTFEKLGDRKAVQKCRSIMMQFVKCGALTGASSTSVC